MKSDIFFFVGLLTSYILGVVIGVVIGIYVGPNLFSSPSAMDVYQGKTTLEITYRDGVAVDSIVVYK